MRDLGLRSKVNGGLGRELVGEGRRGILRVPGDGRARDCLREEILLGLYILEKLQKICK